MNSDLIIWPKPGTYILAVSGGVDSMVLLSIFTRAARDKKYELIVAHFDHGIRPASSEDAEFVRIASKSYDLKFELGKSKRQLYNEAQSRTARYKFLDDCANKYNADGIITAHHQDDLIETSLLNLARGSSRIGLAPFHAEAPLRPLKAITQNGISSYALSNEIMWQEDATNADTTNPRNFIRHILLKNAQPTWRDNYLFSVNQLNGLNNDIDRNIENTIKLYKTKFGYSLPKKLVLDLSQSECSELLLAINRKLSPGVEVDRRLISELVIFIKTAKVGKIRPLHKCIEARISRDYVELNKVLN